MDEKRYYSRLKSGISCLVYSDGKEYVGVIENISEYGIAILLDKKDLVQEINLDERFTVTGLDVEDVIQLYVDVRRIEEKDDKVLVGTHIINHTEIAPYVHEKRLEKFKNTYFNR